MIASYHGLAGNISLIITSLCVNMVLPNGNWLHGNSLCEHHALTEYVDSQQRPIRRRNTNSRIDLRDIFGLSVTKYQLF